MTCPQCKTSSRSIIKKGYYKTKYNHQPVCRYQCKSCKRYFSSKTFKDTYRQHKPQVNQTLFKLLASGVTMRRSAKILGLNKNTIPLKMSFLARKANTVHQKALEQLKTSYVQFDEMETYEQTKLKPVSVALAIQARTGFIIDMEVASMNCKGHMAKLSRRLYGWREDTRESACKSVMNTVLKCSKDNITIASDGKKSYPNIVHSVMPKAKIEVYSRNDSDGLWRLNHTAAKLRADVSRLARRTWSASKKMERLQDHLLIYMAWNNGYSLN